MPQAHRAHARHHMTPSTTLDLPQPLGPTTPETPASKWNVVLSGKDLKPRSSSLRMCMVCRAACGGRVGRRAGRRAGEARAGSREEPTRREREITRRAAPRDPQRSAREGHGDDQREAQKRQRGEEAAGALVSVAHGLAP